MTTSVYSSFNDLPKDLLAINHFPEQPRFFLSHDWFSHLYNTAFHKEYTPRIYVATNPDQSISAALYCAVPNGEHKLVSLTNFYSLEFSIITFCAASSISHELDSLIQFIANERPRWHSLDFRYFHSGEKLNPILEKCLEKHNFALNRFIQYENWYHMINGEDYSSYLEHRPSQLKNTLRRKTKQLKLNHESQIKIFPRDEFDLTEAISDYERVYSSSWKKSEPFCQFIPGLIQLAARLNILLIGVLYIDGKPAASQLWILLPERFVIYKLAYDNKFSRLSVGTILSNSIFAYVYSLQSPGEIDYGIGSEPYKKQWMSLVRNVYGIEAFNRNTLGGLIRLFAYRAMQAVKKMKFPTVR